MDIDFDLPSWFDAEKHFECRRASMVNQDVLEPHPCGYYFENIPLCNGISAIPYEVANELGFQKIDFLSLRFLDTLSFEDLQKFREQEPQWYLLQKEEYVSKLMHLGTRDSEGKLKHLHVLQYIKPSCLEEVADVLSLIRPKNINYIEQYIINKQYVRSKIYSQNGDGYLFKRSHAFSYAQNIGVQLNFLVSKKSFLDNEFLIY
ncbi:MAG: hypothetical protein KDH96_00605 [Candidatus Riesia sp.]|nr:hypothetical protein [Candidatus Riesia sp.]